MKCFRVRGDAGIEPFLRWKRVDGKAYVPVGGLRLSYVTVDGRVADLTQTEGMIERASLLLPDPRKVVLGNEVEVIQDAIVIIPTGGFEFKLAALNCPVKPPESNVASLIIMKPGDIVTVLPVCRNLAECRQAVAHRLSYDGTTVSFVKES